MVGVGVAAAGGQVHHHGDVLQGEAGGGLHLVQRVGGARGASLRSSPGLTPGLAAHTAHCAHLLAPAQLLSSGPSSASSREIFSPQLMRSLSVRVVTSISITRGWLVGALMVVVGHL